MEKVALYMDISDVVLEDYESFSPETTVSKLAGVFNDPSVRGVAVVDDTGYRGVVTRRQLVTSHHQPNQKLGSIVRNVPQLAPTEDIRKVARLMIDTDSHFLPVFEGQQFRGVVTSDAVLEAVVPYLDVATVADVYSHDLLSIGSDATFGKALNILRDNRITHLPVIEDGDAIGILSLYDIIDVTVRPTSQSQGGSHSGTDSHGGDLGDGTGRSSHGGFGAREGESDRILDMPVQDLMASPVRTITPSETLETAAETMLDTESASLVVVDDSGDPAGIVTRTDILDSLTWEAEGNRAVQVYGTEYLDEIDYDWVVDLIDRFDQRDQDLAVLDAKIHLHKHDEKRRGTPLLLARIRLYTDQGLFIVSGEGYGARPALNEARDKMERKLQDHKTHGKSKKAPSSEHWEKRFGWLLESSDR